MNEERTSEDAAREMVLQEQHRARIAGPKEKDLND